MFVLAQQGPRARKLQRSGNLDRRVGGREGESEDVLVRSVPLCPAFQSAAPARWPQTQMGAGVATSPHSSSGDPAGAAPSLETGSGRGFSAPVGSVAFPRRPEATQSRYAVTSARSHPVPPRFLCPKASVPASDFLRKVGSARSGFRHPALRASSSDRPTKPLPAASVLANIGRAPRWQWLAALRPVSGSPLFRPHKQAGSPGRVGQADSPCG